MPLINPTKFTLTNADNNELKYDFAKAQSLLDLINECKQVLDETAQVLGNESANAPNWWKGISFDAFQAKYMSGSGGKSLASSLANKTDALGKRLSKVSYMKKDLEKKVKGSFR